jgi:hypothetical protein
MFGTLRQCQIFVRFEDRVSWVLSPMGVGVYTEPDRYLTIPAFIHESGFANQKETVSGFEKYAKKSGSRGHRPSRVMRPLVAGQFSPYY